MELALKYMEIFFSGGDIDELIHILAYDFAFRGRPFYEFDSAEDYIKSLKSDPPNGFEYEMINSFENDSSACLVYQFRKPGVSVMTKLVRFCSYSIQAHSPKEIST